MAKRYTLEDKLQTAVVYIITGTALKTSKLTGIPRKTIADWTSTDWWPDLITEAKSQKNEELDALLTAGVHLGLEKMTERLKEGDAFVRKDGSIGFKPMTGKDCAVSSAVMIDKRAILRGDPTRITKTTNESDTLADFKKALEDVGKKDEAKLMGEAAKKLKDEDIIRH